MSIELSNEEAIVLRETLESVLSDLSVEIASTDAKDYRDALKARRVMLRTIAERVAPGADEAR